MEVQTDKKIKRIVQVVIAIVIIGGIAFAAQLTKMKHSSLHGVLDKRTTSDSKTATVNDTNQIKDSANGDNLLQINTQTSGVCH